MDFSPLTFSILIDKSTPSSIKWIFCGNSKKKKKVFAQPLASLIDEATVKDIDASFFWFFSSLPELDKLLNNGLLQEA